ncbi:4-amino-4-deoxy-L-arabinose transferase [Fibrobacter sp. UWT3]|uniref:NPCBM/NEW2 domain-containing protein n=1 Tax=Fibrobacter sp. UWT3 TaxID=1896225 RepID=UPI000BD40876|nr:NPCBM/NEW2 domain-containing protein [Fibrobacter sp. UWT3]SOE78807.1 4-amino-4-deoxy-L-arabinose transferase [Fibrobacter sp. UWT3]
MKIKDSILLTLKNLLHPAGLIGLVIALIIPAIIWFLGRPSGGHKEIIRQLDLNLPLPLFLFQMAVAIILFAFLNKDFREWFKGILPQKPFSILAIAAAIGIAVFAGTQIEARHRVQSDESVFMSVAQNMYHNHESGTCNQGIFDGSHLNCIAKSNSFKTKGLAFLYFLGMPLFGTDLHWIFNAELLMLPLAFLLMFLAIVAWTKQPLLAFLAALLMALQPTVLFQFRAMSVEPLYIFLSALSLFIFKWAYDRNTVMHWALLAITLAFFAQTRQETAFCLLSFIFFAFPKILDKKDFKAPTFFVTLSLFSVPALLTISYFQGFGFQGGEFEAHGHFLEDLKRNWIEMTRPLKENGELENPFLTYFNYLFAIGGVYLLFRAIYDTAKGCKFYLWMLVFLVLYHVQTYMILENVSGDFSIQINQRYSLVMLPSMAFVAALPIAHAIEYFAASASKKEAKPLAFAGMVIVAIILSAWTFHYKEDFNKNIMYNRNHLTTEEHEILGWLKEQPEADRLFIYGRPWHFVGYGVSSIHYDKARQMSDAELQKYIDKYNGEVYYIRGLDCWDSQTYHKKAVEHRIATTCDVFEREMDLVGVKNILITNNYWVQIAKFNGRKHYNPTNIIQVSEPAKGIAAPANDSATVTTGESAVENTSEAPLLLNYNLKEQAEATRNWALRITLDRFLVKDTAYAPGEFNVLVGYDKLQPGYNTIRYIVTDTQKNTKLADISKYYFNAAGGASALEQGSITEHRQDWGNLRWNKSIENHEMTINGSKFENGFGTHANSETTIGLEGKYRAFRTSFGLDDESLCSEGVSVQIIGDGQVLATSPVFQSGVVHTLTANTEGVQKLVLKTTAKGSIDCSHVDFVHPVLIP